MTMVFHRLNTCSSLGFEVFMSIAMQPLSAQRKVSRLWQIRTDLHPLFPVTMLMQR